MCVCVCGLCLGGYVEKFDNSLGDMETKSMSLGESKFASSLIPGCFLLGSWLISQDHFLRTGAVHIKGVI